VTPPRKRPDEGGVIPSQKKDMGHDVLKKKKPTEPRVWGGRQTKSTATVVTVGGGLKEGVKEVGAGPLRNGLARESKEKKVNIKKGSSRFSGVWHHQMKGILQSGVRHRTSPKDRRGPKKKNVPDGTGWWGFEREN